MTKPCPDDLAAFKHEPADYEQPVEAVTVGPSLVERLAEAIVSCGVEDARREEYIAFSRAKNSLNWRVAMREAEACLPVITQANEAMREALYRISDAHLPDQPATSSLDETEWAIQHIRRIRAIARAALSGDSA